MGHLAIFALGPLRIELDGKPLQTSRHKALALLVYLAMCPGKQSREALSALLWPDYEQEKAYAYLRRTLVGNPHPSCTPTGRRSAVMAGWRQIGMRSASARMSSIHCWMSWNFNPTWQSFHRHDASCLNGMPGVYCPPAYGCAALPRRFFMRDLACATVLVLRIGSSFKARRCGMIIPARSRSW